MPHPTLAPTCRGCGATIPPARRAALPATPWCLACAETRVERVGGNMVWAHKTAPVLELRPASEAERFARLTRRHAYNASLSLGSISRAMDDAAHVNPFTGE